jgi:enamine deaminase RidA (YjgF/YER057c/UK114 family)
VTPIDTQEDSTMERRTINPWSWQEALGYSQGIEVTAGQRVLYCAGQTASGPDGRPRHAGDMRAQLSAALDNVEAVLGAGGYVLSDVVRLNYYVTDIPAFFASFDAIRARVCASGAPPSGTLLEVARLARPELMVEMEATAVR